MGVNCGLEKTVKFDFGGEGTFVCFKNNSVLRKWFCWLDWSLIATQQKIFSVYGNFLIAVLRTLLLFMFIETAYFGVSE